MTTPMNVASRWVRWAILMTALGLTTAAVVYVTTRSRAWAIGGLLASGAVANAVASAGRGDRNGRGGNR